MTYNLGSVITEIKTRSKDSSLSDTLITFYVQEAQDEILGRHILTFMETAATPTLVQGDVSYAYPTDYQSTLGVRLTDPVHSTQITRPDYLAFRGFDQKYPNPAINTAGRPYEYTDYGRELYWACPLDKAYLMEFKYLRKSTELSSASVVPDIPREYSQFLVRAGLAGVEEYRENFDIAAVHNRKKEDLAEDMISRYTSRQLIRVAQSTTQRVTSRDDGWGG